MHCSPSSAIRRAPPPCSAAPRTAGSGRAGSADVIAISQPAGPLAAADRPARRGPGRPAGDPRRRDRSSQASWLLSRAALQEGAIPEAAAALEAAGSYRAEHPLEPEPAPFVGEARCAHCHREVVRAVPRQPSRFHPASRQAAGVDPISAATRSPTPMTPRSTTPSGWRTVGSASRPRSRTGCCMRSSTTRSARPTATCRSSAGMIPDVLTSCVSPATIRAATPAGSGRPGTPPTPKVARTCSASRSIRWTASRSACSATPRIPGP